MKNNLFKTTFAALCTIGCITAYAQDSGTNTQVTPTHEISVGITGFTSNSFALRYQFDNGQNFLRVGLLALGTNTSVSSTNNVSNDTNAVPNTSNSTTPINLNFGVNVCWGKIKPVNDKFAFVFGPEVGASLNYIVQNNSEMYSFNNGGFQTNSSKEVTTSVRPYIGILLGVKYKISSAFSVYTEIAPDVFYSYSRTVTSSWSDVNSITETNTTKENQFGLANLQNAGATLALAYTF